MHDRSTGYRVFSAFNICLMLFVLFLCLYPFVYMLAISFSSAKAVINGWVSFYPKEFTLETYKLITSNAQFRIGYANTVFYTVGGTAIAMGLMCLMAYPLSKTFLRGRGILMKIVIFSMFFSGGMIPNLMLVIWLHLNNTVWAMLLPFAINQFNLIILVNFFRSLPDSIEEAAVIDGMGYFGILWRIVLPLSTPALATIALYTAVFFWNDWFYSLIYMNSNERYSVMVYLRNIVSGQSMAGAAAGSGSSERMTVYATLRASSIILTSLPIIILYPFLQRFFVKGLTIGSVKG
ncbi:MAG: carbohydrate ABC transporter permease [Oscillospiraceae bacterium]|jgi:putative aldouronate transport system permease protein|nr:carbohydrate ABC transporter permease [Oscillospiraceae bacterium]